MTNSSPLPIAVERLLMRVEKPARYTGGEFHTVLKPADQIEVRLALAFPDVYDVGMSYHGFRILYERVNEVAGLQAERTFAPWPDFEALMRESGLSLYMLESKLPVSSADVVGFTLQHEMNYTNVLNMLDLAGIPQHSRDRDDDHPLVIAGGHGAFNPEVMADFVDVFVIGDGEGALLELLETVRRAKRESGSRGRAGRQELLSRLGAMPGFYVPAFYNLPLNDDGTIREIRPNRDGVPARVDKAIFDLRVDPGPVRPVVPLLRIVHDRLSVEIKRGCTVGCRFCHAGMTGRPVRERDPRQILEIARQGIRNTGYEEISLLSLSSADYSAIVELVRALRNEFQAEGVSVSLPSLRINSFDVDLAAEISGVRKSGFTFAPEAGTERLRRVINKAVDEPLFMETVEGVLRKGWRTLKFYFMCGLPTETEEDLLGIVNLTEQVVRLGKMHCGKTFQLNLSLSPFVPKPQTPFQWHAQPSVEEFESKYRFVESRINRRHVSLKKHNVHESLIEGVLSRGDRPVGRAGLRAWELGCRFDGWKEHFKYGLWIQAFEECGVDPGFFAGRERGADEVFPWDHVDALNGKEFLWQEKLRSESGEVTEDCALGSCSGCRVCDFSDVKNLLTVREDGEFVAPAAPQVDKTAEPAVAVCRVRLIFSKTGSLRFISHLDLAKVIQLIVRRSGVSVARSQGFNPQPKIQLAPPLSLGWASDGEAMDIWLTEPYSADAVLQEFVRIPLEGLEWKSARKIPLDAPSLSAQLDAAEYVIAVDAASGDLEAVETGIRQFASQASFLREVRSKSGLKVRDLRKSVQAVETSRTDGGVLIRMSVSMREGEYVNPVTILESILKMPLREAVSVTRTNLVFA